jgi:hypothetical protein
MAYDLVRARLKAGLAVELREQLSREAFRSLRPFGPALTKGLVNARRDPMTGEAVWEEEDYCRPPLAMERRAVLDRYFEDLRVEPVREGAGWQRIAAMPSLWEPALPLADGPFPSEAMPDPGGEGMTDDEEMPGHR